MTMSSSGPGASAAGEGTTDGSGSNTRTDGRGEPRATSGSMVRSLMIAAGHFFFRRRDAVFPLVFGTLAIATTPLLFGGSRQSDLILDAVGVSVALTGQLLRVAVIGFAYIKRGGKGKRIYAKTLVQEGFFAHCRNPLYLGNILMVAGLALVHNGLWIYVLGVPFFLFAYGSIILAEEEYLHRQFGAEYEDYCRRVPRLLFRFRGLSGTLSGMSYDWKKMVRKEYNTPFWWLTSLLTLLGWEAYTSSDLEAATPEIRVLALIWAVALCAYLVARAAKKSGRLGTD